MESEPSSSTIQRVKGYQVVQTQNQIMKKKKIISAKDRIGKSVFEISRKTKLCHTTRNNDYIKTATKIIQSKI